MQINIHCDHLALSAAQEASVRKKFEKITRLADRLSDEASEVRVKLVHAHAEKPQFRYSCEVTIFAPGATLRAEARKD